MMTGQGSPALLSAEETFDKGMIEIHGFLKTGIAHDATFSEDRDLRRQRGECVDVMRDQDDRERQTFMQLANQRHEGRAALRVQPGRWLIEQQQLWLEYQRSGQGDPLYHAARKLRGHEDRVMRLEFDHRHLLRNQGVHLGWFGNPQLAERKGNVLGDVECRKQRALLKQYAKPAPPVALGGSGTGEQRFAKELHLAGMRACQADDVAQQGGLAATRTAHQGDHFASCHFQLQTLVDDGGAEAGADVRQSHYDLVAHNGTPIDLVAIASTASARMTMVMAVTTDAVVFADRLSVLGLTLRPKWQAMSAISKPNKAPLKKPM